MFVMCRRIAIYSKAYCVSVSWFDTQVKIPPKWTNKEHTNTCSIYLYMFRYTLLSSESNSGLRNSDITHTFRNASPKQKPTAQLLTRSGFVAVIFLLVTAGTLSIVPSWPTVSSQALPFLPNSSLDVGQGQPLPPASHKLFLEATSIGP